MEVRVQEHQEHRPHRVYQQQPSTLWETLNPQESPFESNVDPQVPHPRWSQASERVVDTGDRIPTQYLNGYANLVAKLYPNRKV